jgi:hypothetical protein
MFAPLIEEIEMLSHNVRRRAFACVLLLSGVGLTAAHLSAQAPTTWDLDLAIGAADRMNVDLANFTAKGYRCARVARPDGGFVPRHVAILMARPRQPGVVPKVSDIEVVVGRPEMGRESLEQHINTLAGRGYEMCGFTIAESSSIGRQPYGLVAVMERLEQRAATGVSYRVIRTTGRREEWARMEAGAADGYALAHMVARPGAATDITHDNHYVVEKRPGAERALAYRLERAGNEFDLQQRLERGAKDGYRADVMWPGHDTISILLSRPVEGAWEGRREYEVDESTSARTSALTGPAIRFVPFKGSLFAFYSKFGGTEDSASEGTLDDGDRRAARPAGDELGLLGRINVDGGRGYWPADFAIRQRESGSPRLAALVVMGRAKR